jgi:hypothetical protein
VATAAIPDLFLRTKPEFAALYAALQIRPLTEAELLTRYVLPRLSRAEAPPRARLEILAAIRERWATLCAHAPLVAALRTLPCIPVGVVRARDGALIDAAEAAHPALSAGAASDGARAPLLAPASALFHPRHRLLREIATVLAATEEDAIAAGNGGSVAPLSLSSAALPPLAFPAPSHAGADWLPFLLEIGLAPALDEVALLRVAGALARTAARDVHARVSSRVAAAAFRLLRVAFHGEAAPAAAAVIQHGLTARAARASAAAAVPSEGDGLVGAAGRTLGSLARALGSGAGGAGSGGHSARPGARPGAATAELETAGVPTLELLEELSAFPPLPPLATVVAPPPAAGDGGGGAPLPPAPAPALPPAPALALPTATAILTTAAVAARLAELACVPVLPPSPEGSVYAPPPLAAGAGAPAVALDGSGGGEDGGASAAPFIIDTAPAAADDAASSSDAYWKAPILVRFRDCALPSDAPLCFSSLPVLSPLLVPPPELLLTGRRTLGATGSEGGDEGGASRDGADGEGGEARRAPAGPTVGAAVPAASTLALASPPPRAAVLLHIRTLTSPHFGDD